ncbi:MAG TPA: hypothetical protein DEH22_08535 [Chloroflexi bacterium]|nr:hypothetical protein [Chloroflexota bacterium]
MDKAKRIHTLPVVIGERLSRGILVGMLVLQYLLTIYLVVIGFFTPVMLFVFIALPTLWRMLPAFRQPKPAEKPADYPDVWPNYFVAMAFVHNRTFGMWFLLALIVDTVIKTFMG